MSSKFFGNKHDNKTQGQKGKPTVQNKNNNAKQTQVKKSGRGK
tara:strand:- start:1435 stop:1563 length:129 start_codon:yes stop_codon:yes gene_type:complete